MMRDLRLVLRLLVLALAALAVACGDDRDDGGDGPGARDPEVEKAFLTGMVHHHETGISMAEVARERGEDSFVRRLAADIVATQEREIGQMRSIYRRRFGGELVPDPRGHDGLGLSAARAGMTHGEGTDERLRSADPFDRAFVDEMVPHHRGALAMSRVLLGSDADAEVKRLANAIASAQRREIGEMKAFRARRFGSEETTGGMGHDGGH